MIRDALYYQNRIDLLISRARDNGKIVNKLRRNLRNIQAKTN